MSDPSEFHLLVLDWLWARGFRADEVTGTDAYGSDYAGDTEGGFHSSFEVRITYVVDGKRKFETVEGADMDSLWKYVTA